jgi:hypothetical protein
MFASSTLNNSTAVSRFFSYDDVSIYIRCVGHHYPYSSVQHYQTILGNMTYNKLWLFLDPGCQMNNPLITFLRADLNATIWNHNEQFDLDPLSGDFVGLVSSPRLMLPPGSTWAFWAGVLSDAHEVHVLDVVEGSRLIVQRPLGLDMPQYVYHSDKLKSYFGRLIADEGFPEGRIVYPNTPADREKIRLHQQQHQQHHNHSHNNHPPPIQHKNSKIVER